MIKKSTSLKPIRTINALAERGLASKEDLDGLEQVVENFSLAITPQMYNLIDQNNPDDPIAKQFVPTEDELNILPVESEDPIGDESYAAVRGIIHRYPDRCLFTPVHVCPVYCRFCFRREKVGSNAALSPQELEAAYSYISKHKELWEVILTGGDPLIMKPHFMAKIINRLNEIDHIEIIRIHTRVPVVEPQRINAEMITALKQKKPVYIVLHANHPNEFTPEGRKACADIVDSGIPMLSQSVLLKGVNDSIEVLSELMRCFIRNRVKPYYLHQGDMAKGTQHFRTTIDAGQSLMKQLRGRFSGICQPTYILDIPGGHGKAPIGPNYLNKDVNQEAEDSCYKVEDYQGRVHSYSPYPAKETI